MVYLIARRYDELLGELLSRVKSYVYWVCEETAEYGVSIVSSAVKVLASLGSVT